MTWFAIIAKPQSEALALRCLRQRGYDAFLPLCIVERRPRFKGRPRLERVEVPLFPRYLFAATAPAQGLHDALTAPGVSNIVRTRSGLCLPLADDLLGELRQRGTLDLCPRTVSEHYEFGEWLKIHQGSFAGHIGKVLEMETKPGEVVLGVDILGAIRPISVPVTAVGRVAKSLPSPARAVEDNPRAA
jgi:transcription antitermination factor NusG